MRSNHASSETDFDTQALELVARMEVLAANGDWRGTENLAQHIKSLVLDIPETERKGVLRAFARGLERVQTLALSSRNEVTEKLSEIRRGRVATRAYGQPERPVSGTALR